MPAPLIHEGKTHLPVPTGQYVVGCTDLMIGPDVTNGCFFRLFYPTELDNVLDHSARWPRWIPHEKYIEGYTSTVWLRYLPYIGPKLMNWTMGHVYVPTVFDAKPKNNKKFPVIVFSHGLTACRTTYSAICSELASHGFVVAAPEHRDESACISYNLVECDPGEYTEEWVYFDPIPFEKNDMPLRKRQLPMRVRDCQRTLEVLNQLNDGRSLDHLTLSTVDVIQFKGMMDFKNPIVAGHSFGGATVLRTLAVDNRFKLGLALDAWMWPLQDEKNLPNEIAQPILFINMESFQTAQSLTVMKSFTVGAITERRVITLKGSNHWNQVDTALFMPWYQSVFVGMYSAINPFLAMDLNNRIALNFLRRHIGQVPDDNHTKFVQDHKDVIREGIA